MDNWFVLKRQACSAIASFNIFSYFKVNCTKLVQVKVGCKISEFRPTYTLSLLHIHINACSQLRHHLHCRFSILGPLFRLTRKPVSAKLYPSTWGFAVAGPIFYFFFLGLLLCCSALEQHSNFKVGSQFMWVQGEYKMKMWSRLHWILNLKLTNLSCFTFSLVDWF